MSHPDIWNKPVNGAAWAAIFAAGIGCAAIGMLTDLSEASKPISVLLNFYVPAGDLSGKTIVGLVIWIAAWAILHARWRSRELHHAGRIAAATVILFVLALVATFPLFFGLFAAV